MYKNYFFDLYETLVDIRTNEENDWIWDKLCLYYGYYGAIYDAEELKNEFEKTKTKLLGLSSSKVPTINIEDIFYKLFKVKGIKPKKKHTRSIVKAYRMLITESIDLNEGVCDLLKAIKDKDKNLYIISNEQSLYGISELKLLGLYDYFKECYFSSDLGVSMPEEAFLKKVMDDKEMKPKDCIVISNKAKEVLTPAKSLKMSTVHISKDSIKDNQWTYVVEENKLTILKDKILKTTS
ncbi:putative hydrolase of the HAD superfamily [Natranaerovirga hydrolytica]|uniref:Putative hydrolase of the HAD superfamily n=1 Tax=Natranaerovirga hydrolytica TaxID=680378 RepID=A0A4R1MRS1_9FIRM|nr:HAD family hydrolase [Natranaerovirga hydrolytica]TCK93269.1 putative hydrolase of the HAD superfamily [Natranaerovirga hydrolytica]